MSNPFEKAIEDIFSIQQFLEYFTYYLEDEASISSSSAYVVQVPCIAVYNNNVDAIYTEYGVDDGVNFYLTCKVADFTPKKGMKITFRDITYRIDTFYADSFNLTYNILLKSLTTKI